MKTEYKHYLQYPCMTPRVGKNYAAPEHKRLLILGESHYLPKKSIAHLDAEAWYANDDSSLSSTEKCWVSTSKIITESAKNGFKNKAHSIYKNIAWELNEAGIKNNDFCQAIEEVAYYNFFQRPAIEGLSLEVAELDVEVAEATLTWFIENHSPELIVFTSTLAGGFAKKTLAKYNLPYVVTPHPGCAWWNKTAKKYKGMRGRDLLSSFLSKEQWMNI